MRTIINVTIFFVLSAGAAFMQERGLPPGVTDTQDPRDKPHSPAEAVRRFKAPAGFHVTLFAGEPDVQQPIAMAFDDRGRLWIAECFSYPKWLPPEKAAAGRDRILIFEDVDGDGRFDKRTVFRDRLPNLTGLTLGYGGVWALCAPNLVFIPDRNADDVPDGPPEVVLDGWTLLAQHNIVNGLTWGPDGWLWGRHGITAESRVGRPGTPDSQRVRLNCSIWRYHPTRKLFEVVTHGTTNPWGLDFDDHGEAFFTNSVIGHLWHVVPGARFQRMYGLDYNPHAYELIASTSDHLHWGGGHWTDSRGGKGVHHEAGGGHAHAGAMIYLGDNWPDEYRHSIFMCNIHGNRINRNVLERKNAAVVGKRAPDFLLADNPWFRGTALGYGPDGGVFVTDWCDFGECHDHDGVHRSSGRIYKVFHGKPRSVAGLDLARKSDAELVELQLHKNDWYVRHARRLLTERAAAGKPMANVHERLRAMYRTAETTPQRLRALWTLYVTGGADEAWLLEQLRGPSEHVVSWAVRLLGDGDEPSAAARQEFLRLAHDQSSSLVRLYLSSALQRLKLPDRFALAARLAMPVADRDDREIPLILWYGIEPAVSTHADQALALAESARIPKLRRFIVRRLAEDSAAGLDPLIALLSRLGTTAKQLDVLEGVREGLKGRRKVPMPRGWDEAFAHLEEQAATRLAARRLGLIFGDARAEAALRKTLTTTAAPVEQRTTALETLVEHQVPDVLPLLFKLVDDVPIRGRVMRALAAYSSPDVPPAILRVYAALNDEDKQAALGTLASRPAYALALLDAIDQKRLPRADVSAFTARQLQDLRDKQVSERLSKVWGQLRQTPAEKKALIAKYKELLTPEVVRKGDPSQGRVVYQKLCAQCHVLFGEGTKIGPDLTGSNRADLHYVLENVIDPSATIGRDYQLSNIVTTSGRLISGIVVEETDRAVTMQTATERVVVTRPDIDERRLANISMMPEGMLEQMSFAELRDLVRYLASKEPPRLPK